eukprot:6738-Heterococcus_DN1.PRE.2
MQPACSCACALQAGGLQSQAAPLDDEVVSQGVTIPFKSVEDLVSVNAQLHKPVNAPVTLDSAVLEP